MSRVIPFGLGGYRSFAAPAEYLPVDPRINLIAGPNNSGKSNVLRFIAEQYNKAAAALNEAGHANARWKLEGLEANRTSSGAIQFAVGLPHGGTKHQELLTDSTLLQRFDGRDRLEKALDRLFTLPQTARAGYLWLTYGATADHPDLTPRFLDAMPEDGGLDLPTWRALCVGMGAGPESMTLERN